MNITQRRFIYYLIGCMGARLTLTYLIKKRVFPKIGIIPLIIGIGFLYIYLFGSKKADGQLKWANAKVWWNDYRIVHGLLYTSAGILSISNNSCAWILLAIDTLLGLILFLNYHIIKN